MKHGKKYVDSAKLIDHLNAYDPAEACELACKTSKAKFDETIEISVRLGVDPRHADQQVRGAVVLPHGTGRTVRVLVVTKGDKVKEAEAAGADFVGGEEMVHKIQTESWFGFLYRCSSSPTRLSACTRPIFLLTLLTSARRAAILFFPLKRNFHRHTGFERPGGVVFKTRFNPIDQPLALAPGLHIFGSKFGLVVNA